MREPLVGHAVPSFLLTSLLTSSPTVAHIIHADTEKVQSAWGKLLGVGRRSDLERVQDGGDDAVVTDETGELHEPRYPILALEPVEQGLGDAAVSRDLPDVVDHVPLGGRKTAEVSARAHGGDGSVARSRLSGRRRMGRPDIGTV